MYHTPWNYNYGWFQVTELVLGIRPRASARATGVRNHRAISPALCLISYILILYSLVSGGGGIGQFLLLGLQTICWVEVENSEHRCLDPHLKEKTLSISLFSVLAVSFSCMTFIVLRLFFSRSSVMHTSVYLIMTFIVLRLFSSRSSVMHTSVYLIMPLKVSSHHSLVLLPLRSCSCQCKKNAPLCFPTSLSGLC